MNKIIANKLIAFILSLSMLISLVPSFSLTFTAETTEEEIIRNFVTENSGLVSDDSYYDNANAPTATINADAYVFESYYDGAYGISAETIAGEKIWLVRKIVYTSGAIVYEYSLDNNVHDFYSKAVNYKFIPAEYITPITGDGSTDSGEETENTCNCGSSTSVHAATCPLYVAPVVCQICGVENGHASDCTTLCTCTPVDGVHQEGCLLYSETDGDDDDDSQITPTVCDKCGQASCICCTTCGNYPCTCPTVVLPEPSVTLDYPISGIIAENITPSVTTATINASYVNLYKSLDYGADGICIPVEAGTQITLVTQYTFTTADGATYTFYRYDYDGSNTDLYNACISEIGGYPFIYAGDVTFGNISLPSNTGVSVSGANLPGDVSLTVEPKSLTDTGLDTNLYPVGDASLFYDVTLYQNGAEYQPTNGITVTFPESAILANGFAVGDSYHVYHIHDGVVEMSAAAVYNGGDLDLVFANLSAVGIAGTEVKKNFLTDEGDIVSYTDYLDNIPATITDNSVVLYDYIEDGANGITVEGVADYSIILTQKIEYSTTGLVLYRFEYILDSTDSNYDADFYNIVNSESSSGGGYEYIPATYLTIDGEEDGTAILEEIFWELMETVSKDDYSEVLNKYATELSLYTFTTEQQEVLDYHYFLIPYRADMIYTPWSGRVGPLMPPITLPSPFLRMAYAVSLADDTSDSSTTVDNTALKTSKIVTSNDDGTYTITIEAYAEGHVTVTTTKTAVDVILVLDYSQSMTNSFDNTTRFAALKTAVNNFVDAIIDEANGADNLYGTADDIDHRLAVVTYKSNADIVFGLRNLATSDGSSDINSWAEGMSRGDGSGTQSAYGLSAAIDVFDADTNTSSSIVNDTYISETRQRVVLFFTDGYPTTSGSSHFDANIAKDAINYANTLKNTYGATVYSVAVISGADPSDSIGSTVTGTSGNKSGPDEVINAYLHAVSSNYPNATATGSITITMGTGGNNNYYLTAGSTSELNGIFDEVANTVISGGTSVDLGTETTVKDIVTPYFAVPANASGVLVQSFDCTGYSNGAYTWDDTSATTLSGTYTDSEDNAKPYVSINGQTLDVSGFDFTHNYVAQTGRDENNPSATGSFYGRKLRITFTITPDPFFLGGNGVPTNESSSGIYDKDGVLYENLIPEPGSVDVALIDLSVKWQNQHIYATNNADIAELFKNATVTSRDGKSTSPLATVLDGENNAYVDIVFTIKDPNGNIVGIYTVEDGEELSEGSWNQEATLTPTPLVDSPYSLTWTITPSEPGDATTINHTEPETATVFVYKPKITFKDTGVYYDGATTVSSFTGNYVGHIWEGSQTYVAENMHVYGITADGENRKVPGFSFTYSPSSVGVSTTDTYVNVTVETTGTDDPRVLSDTATADLPAEVTFDHIHCTGETFDASNGEFIVHVYRPVLTFTDSYEVFGNAPSATVDYYNTVNNVNDMNNITWEPVTNGITVADADFVNNKPSLSLSYSPEYTGWVSDGIVTADSDFYVNVTVKVGNNDITDVTRFVHQNIQLPSDTHTVCLYEFESSKGEFIVHIDILETDLTITKTVSAEYFDVDASFVFTVMSFNKENEQVEISVIISGGDFVLNDENNYTASVVIDGLKPKKGATVSEDTSWSWRYKVNTPINVITNLVPQKGQNKVSFVNVLDDEQWLTAEDYVENIFNTVSESNG